jgi:pimeloyl-ACP methyl ester carboxylesterase
MTILKLHNRDIYYEQHGNGVPLILIAGLGSDSVSWLPVIMGLAKHFKVITFDNRGVGRSSKDNSNISIKDMTDDCAVLINNLELSPVNVVGHSMGGMIAMDLSIRYPKLVDKLILEATAPTMSNRNVEMLQDWVSFLKSGMDKKLWFRNMYYWIFSPSFFSDKVMLDQYVDMAVRYRYAQSDNSFENQVVALSEFDCQNVLSEIKARTLVIYGEQDILFLTNETDQMFDTISDMDSVTIKNAAHSIHMDEPEVFIRNIVDFLAG